MRYIDLYSPTQRILTAFSLPTRSLPFLLFLLIPHIPVGQDVHPGRPSLKVLSGGAPLKVKREGSREGSPTASPDTKAYEFTFDNTEDEKSPFLDLFPTVHIGRSFLGRNYRSGGGSAFEDSAVLRAISTELGLSSVKACQLFVEKAGSTKVSFEPNETTTLQTLAEVLTGCYDLEAVSGRHSTGLYLVWAERVFLSTRDSIFIANPPAVPSAPRQSPHKRTVSTFLESVESLAYPESPVIRPPRTHSPLSHPPSSSTPPVLERNEVPQGEATGKEEEEDGGEAMEVDVPEEGNNKGNKEEIEEAIEEQIEEGYLAVDPTANSSSELIAPPVYPPVIPSVNPPVTSLVGPPVVLPSSPLVSPPANPLVSSATSAICNAISETTSDESDEEPLHHHRKRHRQHRVITSDDDEPSSPLPPPLIILPTVPLTGPTSSPPAADVASATVTIPQTALVVSRGICLSRVMYTPGTLDKVNSESLVALTEIIAEGAALTQDTTHALLEKLKPLALFR